MSDIVEALEAVIGGSPPDSLLRRARDEIVLLRRNPTSVFLLKRARAEALEEAAQICEQEPSDKFTNCAAAIRALKETP